MFYETVKTNGEALKSSGKHLYVVELSVLRIETICFSTATQLTQSAHFSLQMPFVLFGLGQTPNFVDTIIITLPHRHAEVGTQYLFSIPFRDYCSNM